MKRLYYLFAILCVCASLGAQAGSKLGSFTNFSTKVPGMSREWKGAQRHLPLTPQSRAHKVVTEGETKIGPVHSYGVLNGPNGAEWVYTANFDMDGYSYSAAHITIYNEKGEVMGTIIDSFTLKEHQTSVNSVEVNPYVTQKFFNVDDKYEVIIFVHVTTDDYYGDCYQHIFSLAPDQTEPLMTIPGNQILVADLATDAWSEKKQMVMMRETFGDDYLVEYDIYDRAGWSSTKAPVLLHTFKISYSQLAGSGSHAYPIAVQNVNGKAHYAVSYYEKPFFDPDVPFYEEPVVTPDNNFVIDLYTSDCFNTEGEVVPVKTIKIPMENVEGYLFSCPGLGGFMGNNDFSIGLFDDTTNPYFVLTYDNYIPSSDDFISEFRLYDSDGNYVKTIAENATDYVQLTNISGNEIQFCLTNDAMEELQFINIPSCEMVAQIPYRVDDRLLSTSIDRVPFRDTYRIVVAGSNGEDDGAGNTLHPIAYFNSNGSLNHWDMVNLGPDVVMAQPAIISNWLNPFLFNTDEKMEYMFLTKLPTATTASEEHFWVVNTEGSKLADFGPSADGELTSVAVINEKTQYPVLNTAYYAWESQNIMLNFNSLPFSIFPAGGNGTAENPYLISTPGDLLQIAKAPQAHYKVVNDINCDQYPFLCPEMTFSGTLDGDNHLISNLSLTVVGLLGAVAGTGCVKNLRLAAPSITPNSLSSGVIASTMSYDGSEVPSITNVHIINAKAEGDYEGNFGTIVGEMNTGALLSECSVQDSHITLPHAIVGGVVGKVAPSGADIKAVAFSGTLAGDVAGGIVGAVSKVGVENAHVNANIEGGSAAGGIVGTVEIYQSARGTFNHCYVEGALASDNDDDPSVGGIAGMVEWANTKSVTNNVVAVTDITFADEPDLKTAHRIVGHSSGDLPGEIDWESPWWDEAEDPYSHPELWPRLDPVTDEGFNNNYALDWLAPINGDTAMALDANSVEGKSLAESDFSQEFLTQQGFAFGSEATSPWAWEGGKAFLWFEPVVFSGASITPAAPQAMRIVNGTLNADGAVDVFSIAGAKVAQGSHSLSLTNLAPGIYIAKSGNTALKFIVK